MEGKHMTPRQRARVYLVAHGIVTYILWLGLIFIVVGKL